MNIVIVNATINIMIVVMTTVVANNMIVAANAAAPAATKKKKEREKMFRTTSLLVSALGGRMTIENFSSSENHALKLLQRQMINFQKSYFSNYKKVISYSDCARLLKIILR